MAIIDFPPLNQADENGLLGVGGDLEVSSLALAYSKGIFPWPISEEIPLAWFSPDPRGILEYKNLHISRSLRKIIKKEKYIIKFNTAFEQVIMKCAAVTRKGQDSTWITDEIIYAYINLFQHEKAYSVDAYNLQGKLVGGIYGVCINGNISGESMFHEENNVSKICLYFLMQKLHHAGINFLDTQMVTDVVKTMGGSEIPRETFIQKNHAAKKITRADIF